jgi:ABC-2 type transport system permease protein
MERLAAAPISITTILMGDVLASVLFGMGISLVPILSGMALGVTVEHPFVLAVGIVLAAFCFSAMGLIFSSTPTSMTSTVKWHIYPGRRYAIMGKNVGISVSSDLPD